MDAYNCNSSSPEAPQIRQRTYFWSTRPTHKSRKCRDQLSWMDLSRSSWRNMCVYTYSFFLSPYTLLLVVDACIF